MDPSLTPSESPAELKASYEAVSELFECWVSPSENGDDESCIDNLLLDEPLPSLPEETKRPRPTVEAGDDILAQLKKRCRPYMLPSPVPTLRRRKRPNCIFLNYLGTRQYQGDPRTTFAAATKTVFPTSTPTDPPTVAPDFKRKAKANEKPKSVYVKKSVPKNAVKNTAKPKVVKSANSRVKKAAIALKKPVTI